MNRPDTDILKITTNHKFRTKTAKCNLSSKPHSTPWQRKQKSILKAYRAYDKQKILQEIHQKIMQQQYTLHQNKQLKTKIQSNIKIPQNLQSGQILLMLTYLQQDNNNLMQFLKKKQYQLVYLKKSPQYTYFIQNLIQYSNMKQEIERVHTIIEMKKKQKVEQKKMYNKVQTQCNNQIAGKQLQFGQIICRNKQKQNQLRNLKANLKKYKDKNKNLRNNKYKLVQQIEQFKQKLVQNNTITHKNIPIIKSYQYNKQIYNQVIKTKSSRPYRQNNQEKPTTYQKMCKGYKKQQIITHKEINQQQSKQQKQKQSQGYDEDQDDFESYEQSINSEQIF